MLLLHTVMMLMMMMPGKSFLNNLFSGFVISM